MGYEDALRKHGIFVDKSLMTICNNYKDALEIEFERAGIAYQRERIFDVRYKGIILSHRFKADFVVNRAYGETRLPKQTMC